ncbi:ribosomal protein S12 methylthiotransferase accessory factor [Roseibium hamelinense]|uniref:Ribosomal protein S12 methylthiotransferase accessory factor n=1 Tax=Roseibium hamelinense TaxID=150831 RepID=A0A562TGN2_9HYPH|nr:YcaO-like family protein [Roseibium hamelinense]MTI46082.1 hypothetical protein [Roseibium hamelinense]TWI92725.1 ribosomal protein S12 methylthiotransferase accessory factor [Roseibium hamelinense]
MSKVTLGEIAQHFGLEGPGRPFVVKPDADLSEPVQDLVRAGILSLRNGGLIPAHDVSPADLALFAPMVDLVRPKLRHLAQEQSPWAFCTAMATPYAGKVCGEGGSHRTIAAGGQGESAGHAVLACLGELSERLSFFLMGEDNRVSKDCSGLPDLALGPVLGFSARQEMELARRHAVLRQAFDGNLIDWNKLSRRRVIAKNVTLGGRAAVPSMGVFFGEAPAAGVPVRGLASTVGAAVWGSFEGAVERAIYEAIERDAVAMAWYNRLGITSLEMGGYPQAEHEKKLSWLENRSRQTRFFRVESDLPVHVVCAISANSDGYWGAFGAAASGRLGDAVAAAAREMLQCEQSLKMAARSHDKGHLDAKEPIALKYARYTRIFDDLRLSGVPRAPEALFDQSYSFEDLLEACRAKSIALWACDITHPAFKIPAIKVLSPQLCTWQARFGKRRLFETPVALGWRGKPAEEDTFEERVSFPF